ncbi:ankyrin repeat-containing protein At5g02620-like isoform X1 [Sesamum indicum]|uniref:Ankyrin repeat-containing protein At5g02620-like isoform X1 n=1 Tax=Sesamum indicum TaxID=4182 RepID=A0A8M8V4D9_SESIN|nr:ankyrin repeat-containing protein At5g02620-like isoform X1 [Sesamum indicum]
MARKFRLQRSRKSKKNVECSSRTDSDGSLHSAASKFDDDCSSATTAGESSVQITGASHVHHTSGDVVDVPVADKSPPTRPQPGGEGNGPTSQGKRSERRSLCCALMYQAALRGDWQAAALLLETHPNLATEQITQRGDTALHVAAATKRTKFVQELVNHMSANDLLSKNVHGHTAFSYAAASGIVEIAAVMMEKNENLITNSGNNEMKPIYIAALLGNRDMVSYLYQFTRVQDLSIDEWFHLLIATLRNNMHDIALDILNKNSDGTSNRSLATRTITSVVKGKNGYPSTTKNEGTALHKLAEQDLSDINARQEAILETFLKTFATVPLLSRYKKIFDRPLVRKRAWLVAERLWAELQRSEGGNAFELLEEPPILHEAAKVGNVVFITMLTRSDPDLIWKIDSNKHYIFHTAVLHRQENVFSLIHQIGSMKELIAISLDNNCNNIMHLAGKLAPPDRLKTVSGAALQMQRELLWFKEVEKVVPPSCLEMRNGEGLRPRELFSLEHKSLLIKGETWMKDTANNCMIVAALIATVAFAAAFTLPGGNNSDTGMPILMKKTYFTFFAVSNGVALFSSTASIIMFLSILTSRYQEDDFLVSLPTKLIFGLATLFTSIVGMVIAFTTTFFLLFHEEKTSVLKWIAVSACVYLITLFAGLHIQLWIDTICSAYRSRFLFGKSKHTLY